MSRNLLILLGVMCAAVAGLLIYSKSKPKLTEATPGGTVAVEAPVVPPPPTSVPSPPPVVKQGSGTPPLVNPALISPQPPTVPPQLKTGLLARTTGLVPIPTNDMPEVPDTKPLPVLEKDYFTSTNRDDRLDIMMDISDWPGPESIRVLTRLFQQEMDPELKVDLLDSLLGIEGHPEEKLLMLTMGTQKGLPTDVRQAAIDGLIDLEDPRVIPILNGLLNDPDEEIRESAKDAVEMLQTPPTTLK